jgi:predicted kinase
MSRKLKRPKFISMAGAIASGKTTLARQIARESGAVLFSIDEWVGKIGRPKNFKEYSDYYFPCWDLIASLSRELLTKGISVVLDFGGNSDKERERTKAAYAGVDCDRELFFLNTPPAICAERFKKRNENPETEIREESLREAERAGIKNIFEPPLPGDGYNVIEIKLEQDAR